MEFLAGSPDDFEEGVDERYKNGFGVWIVKEEGRLLHYLTSVLTLVVFLTGNQLS